MPWNEPAGCSRKAPAQPLESDPTECKPWVLEFYDNPNTSSCRSGYHTENTYKSADRPISMILHQPLFYRVCCVLGRKKNCRPKNLCGYNSVQECFRHKDILGSYSHDNVACHLHRHTRSKTEYTKKSVLHAIVWINKTLPYLPPRSPAGNGKNHLLCACHWSGLRVDQLRRSNHA